MNSARYRANIIAYSAILVMFKVVNIVIFGPPLRKGNVSQGHLNGTTKLAIWSSLRPLISPSLIMMGTSRESWKLLVMSQSKSLKLVHSKISLLLLIKTSLLLNLKPMAPSSMRIKTFFKGLDTPQTKSLVNTTRCFALTTFTKKTLTSGIS